MTHENARIAAVVLAGGEGRRIGGGKPLRRLAGERLIDRALRQARQWSDLVAVSVRTRDQVQPVDALLLLDCPRVGGPLGGLISAFQFGQQNCASYVLTLPADTPLLPRDLAQRLLSNIGDSQCALASSGGRVHPICGLWRTTALSAIERYLESGARSVMGFGTAIGSSAVEWSAEPVDPFFNVNDADDLDRAGQLV